MTLRQFRGYAAKKIYESPLCPDEKKDIKTAEFEADVLIEHFAGTECKFLERDKDIPEKCEKKLIDALERKLSGEPLQYIIGEWEFYGIRIFCGKGCLIPRPETEFVAEYIIKKLPRGGRFLDLCTGSGCIPAAVLKHREDAACVAVDISEEALHYAEKNFRYHMLESRAEIVRCDISEYFPCGDFDIISSNPPYIKSGDMKTLSCEVLQEPHIALDGGEDGLLYYRLILNRYLPYLKKNGIFVFEAGYDTADSVAFMLAEKGFETEIIRDYSGISRVVAGGRKCL